MGLPLPLSSSSKIPILLRKYESAARNETEMLDHVIVRFERINSVLGGYSNAR